MFKFVYYATCLTIALFVLYFLSNSVTAMILVGLFGILGFSLGKRLGIASGGWGDNASWLFALIFMAAGVLLYRNYLIGI